MSNLNAIRNAIASVGPANAEQKLASFAASNGLSPLTTEETRILRQYAAKAKTGHFIDQKLFASIVANK